MTQEIRTITIGAGQARPRRRSQKHTRRRVRLNGWTVAKYAALTVAGVLLFRAGAAYALTERGYKAIGGEVFALFLPVFYYTISATVRDYIKEIKSIFGRKRTMKKLAELKPGDRFMYGGVEWVKFEDIGAGTLCLAAEPVFAGHSMKRTATTGGNPLCAGN